MSFRRRNFSHVSAQFCRWGSMALALGFLAACGNNSPSTSSFEKPAQQDVTAATVNRNLKTVGVVCGEQGAKLIEPPTGYKQIDPKSLSVNSTLTYVAGAHFIAKVESPLRYAMLLLSDKLDKNGNPLTSKDCEEIHQEDPSVPLQVSAKSSQVIETQYNAAGDGLAIGLRKISASKEGSSGTFELSATTDEAIKPLEISSENAKLQDQTFINEKNDTVITIKQEVEIKPDNTYSVVYTRTIFKRK